MLLLLLGRGVGLLQRRGGAVRSGVVHLQPGGRRRAARGARRGSERGVGRVLAAVRDGRHGRRLGTRRRRREERVG